MSNAQTGDKTFCLHGEEHADVIEIGLFGKQLLIVSCGPFGESEIGRLKKVKSSWHRISRTIL